MTNKIVAFVLAAAAGCGSVMSPAHGSGGGDDDTGSNGSGSDEGPPPPPATPLTFYGAIKDERNDQIAFVNGSPVHTHSGAATQIQGNGDCPAIYKYAYLTDRAPKFGREATANPLAFLIQANDTVDPGASSFQVRTEDNRVLVAWKDMTPDADNIYTMTLNRDDGAELGTYVGKLYVDARFHDSAGAETIKTQCFEHHPLQAPLQVAAFQPSTLFGLSLTAKSPLAALLNTGEGIAVDSFAITQYTAEPIDLTFTAPPPTGQGTRSATNEYVAISSKIILPTHAPRCGGTPDPCAPLTVAPVSFTQTAAFSTGWQLRIVDDVTGSAICNQSSEMQLRCVIPARTANESPHTYHLVIADSAESSVWPTLTAATFGDYQLTANFYATGQELDTVVYCTDTDRTDTGIGYCDQQTTYTRINALDAAKLVIDPINVIATSNVGDAAFPSIAADALSVPAQTWDGGSRP